MKQLTKFFDLLDEILTNKHGLKDKPSQIYNRDESDSYQRSLQLKEQKRFISVVDMMYIWCQLCSLVREVLSRLSSIYWYVAI